MKNIESSKTWKIYWGVPNLNYCYFTSLLPFFYATLFDYIDLFWMNNQTLEKELDTLRSLNSGTTDGKYTFYFELRVRESICFASVLILAFESINNNIFRDFFLYSRKMKSVYDLLWLNHERFVYRRKGNLMGIGTICKIFLTNLFLYNLNFPWQFNLKDLE